MRTAKIVFHVLWPVIGLLAATVLVSRWDPILALIAGTASAWSPRASPPPWWRAAGAPHPVVVGRRNVLAAGLAAGWVELADHTALTHRLVVATTLAGVPVAIGPVRRRLYRVGLVPDHPAPIRTCFAEFIITNRTGSLPLILWAIPTPVGERVWISASRPGPGRLQDRPT